MIFGTFDSAEVLNAATDMGGMMIDATEGVNVSLPDVGCTQTEEAKLTSDIKSLWTAHQTTTASAKRTKEELEDLRLDLGWKLSEMKSVLVRTGRSGGWSSYLRTHGIPRATAERNVKRYEALSNPETNCLTDTLSGPAEEDIRRLVRRLLPRLRKVLTTPESVSLFVDEVAQQFQASVADINTGKIATGQVEIGTSSGSGVTTVRTVA